MAVYMVSQREARSLRPNMTAGLIFVIGIVVVLIGQLVLNMILTQDAYQLRSLKIEKRDLATQVQILQEEVDSLASPQNLADAANRLGMVANPASVLLDIESDKVYGKPKPADPATAAVASGNLVANSAMGTVSEFSAATVASAEVSAGVETEQSSEPVVTLQAGEIPASPTR
ncbi:hypothetical protein HRU87_04220 [Aquiluna borgnonia]|jgi:hypothetical protein|uniref:Cell division protein FtsL n=1 Tax=Aquiluna borgnonia TaxID=2499157 RepID=A0A7D4TJ60_9MICO|nr:hypothetical protein [Aquiluna borgnonia]QKJ25391.1 hypothetical protein HRU87_04220 [Aquiluna borgnonia]